MKLSNIQILLLRLALGAFFLSIGLQKYHDGWLTNAGPLTESLRHFAEHSGGFRGSYLRTVAIPLGWFWSKAIVVGELAAAASLLLGLLVRASSLAALFMVLNFHVATGSLFTWDFFGNTSGALLLAGLAAMFLSRAGRWAGIDAALAKANGKGALW